MSATKVARKCDNRRVEYSDDIAHTGQRPGPPLYSEGRGVGILEYS